MSDELKKQIEEFQKLDLETKKAKLLNVLEALKNAHEYFPQLIEIIKTNQKITAEWLDGLYQDIMEYGDSLTKNEREKALDRLNAIKIKIDQIRAQEAAERAKENPDDLLKNM